MHQQKYVFLSNCPKVLLESHPEHRPILHVYPQLSPVPNYTALLYRGNGLREGFYTQQRRDPDLVRDPDPGFIYRN